MKKLHNLQRLARFFKDRRGMITPMTALSIGALLMAVGAGLDYSAATNYRAELQRATDQAALAAIAPKYLSNASRERIARDMFNARLPDAPGLGELYFAHGPDVIQIAVSARLDTMMSGAIGRNSVSIAALSKATIGKAGQAGRPVELALVVDTTDSVGLIGGGVGTLHRAVKGLVEATFGGMDEDPSTKVNLIPTADRVNIDPRLSADWLHDLPEGWGGCFEPRQGTLGGFDFAVDDAPPSVARFRATHRTTPRPHNYGRRFSDHSGCPSRAVLAESNPARVVAQAGRLKLGGTRRPDLALAWGWRSLSPRWADLFGIKGFPAPYNLVSKRIVMISDGVTLAGHWDFGEWQDPDGRGAVNGSGTVPRTPFKSRVSGAQIFGKDGGSETLFAHMLDLCTRVKMMGIEIDLIAIGENDHAAEYFRACASSPDRFYPAKSIGQFESAIEQIAETLGGGAASRRTAVLVN